MPHYASFVLRVWSSSRHGRPQWVARLEDLHNGCSEQFASSEALLTHLRGLLDGDDPKGPDPPASLELSAEPE